MKKSIKILATFLAVILVFTALPLGSLMSFAEGVTNGTTGDCAWSLSGNTLTISGNGCMEDYTSPYFVPWYDYRLSINNVIIGDNVTNIGSYAFYECTELTSIEIPDSVVTIGSYAFYECTKLTSIEIPDSVVTIGSYAFYSCIGLTNIIIPRNVRSIFSFAFSCCIGLTNINIPSNLSVIDSYVFAGCTGLNTVTIENGVIDIGPYSFISCSALTGITIPESVVRIGDAAFYYCYSLKTVKYLGIKEQWEKIAIGISNDPLLSAELEIKAPTVPSPENLTCTAYTKSTLTLSWDKVDGVKGYKIYNVTTGKSYKIKGAENTTYKIQNLKECKNYDFIICSFVNWGSGDIYSEYSQSFRYCTRPSGVDVVSVENSSSGDTLSFTVAHTAVDNVSGYEVKYQLVGSKNYKTYNRTNSDPKTIEVAKKGTYMVWTRAYKSAKYDGVNKFKANGDWSENYSTVVVK